MPASQWKAWALLGTFGLAALSPLSAAERPSFEKKLYVDQHKRIYLPSSMPVYLHLSTSPQGPTIPLENKATLQARLKGDLTSPPKPFYFREGQGRQTVIHPEEADWKHDRPIHPMNVHFFHVDDSAPRTKLQVSKAPQVAKGKRIVFGKPVKLALEAEDRGYGRDENTSGLAGLLVRLEPGDWGQYQGPVQVEQEGTYQLQYFAVDNVGNAEPTHSFAFGVDLSPPRSQIKAHGPQAGQVLSAESSLELSASDNLAGVGDLRYQFKSPKGIKAKPGKVIGLKGLKEGAYQVEFFALDQVGNQEAPQVFDFTLDLTAPLVSTKFLGEKAQRNKKLYLGPDSKLEITASDEPAGVKAIYLKEGKKTLVYNQPYPLPNREGDYSLPLWAVDRVGNQTRQTLMNFAIDRTPPRTNLQFKGGRFNSPSQLYISPKTKILLPARDEGAGVKQTLFQVDAQPAQPFTQPLQVSQEGEHRITYYSVDRVSNKEQLRSLSFQVDATPPEIGKQFSVSPLNQAEVDQGKTPIFAKGNRLFLSATDKAAGLEAIHYQVQKGKLQRYEQSLVLEQPGKFKLLVLATDRVGNQSKLEIEYQVK